MERGKPAPESCGDWSIQPRQPTTFQMSMQSSFLPPTTRAIALGALYMKCLAEGGTGLQGLVASSSAVLQLRPVPFTSRRRIQWLIHIMTRATCHGYFGCHRVVSSTCLDGLESNKSISCFLFSTGLLNKYKNYSIILLYIITIILAYSLTERLYIISLENKKCYKK